MWNYLKGNCICNFLKYSLLLCGVQFLHKCSLKVSALSESTCYWLLHLLCTPKLYFWFWTFLPAFKNILTPCHKHNHHQNSSLRSRWKPLSLECGFLSMHLSTYPSCTLSNFSKELCSESPVSWVAFRLPYNLTIGVASVLSVMKATHGRHAALNNKACYHQ